MAIDNNLLVANCHQVLKILYNAIIEKKLLIWVTLDGSRVNLSDVLLLLTMKVTRWSNKVKLQLLNVCAVYYRTVML